MPRLITRLASALIAAGLPLGVITATSPAASAATGAAQQQGRPATSGVAVKPASQPSWCGWTPANDSGDPGQITYSYVNIRTGQGTQCNIIGSQNGGDWVTVRCYITNGGGQDWYYIDGNVRGWVIANSVLAWWNPVQC